MLGSNCLEAARQTIETVAVLQVKLIIETGGFSRRTAGQASD